MKKYRIFRKFSLKIITNLKNMLKTQNTMQHGKEQLKKEKRIDNILV